MIPDTEHRAGRRHLTLKGGKMVFNSGRSSIDCMVRNLSAEGAKLKVESQIGIPDSFELVLSDSQKHNCRVVWRKAKEIGVTFAVA
ncbi:MAG: PilZ domain-containing protein [Devosia sp.]